MVKKNLKNKFYIVEIDAQNQCYQKNYENFGKGQKYGEGIFRMLIFSSKKNLINSFDFYTILKLQKQ